MKPSHRDGFFSAQSPPSLFWDAWLREGIFVTLGRRSQAQATTCADLDELLTGVQLAHVGNTLHFLTPEFPSRRLCQTDLLPSFNTRCPTYCHLAPTGKSNNPPPPHMPIAPFRRVIVQQWWV
jgi:hypothetical protein